MNVEEFAKRFVWPSDRDGFLAYVGVHYREGELDDITNADGWRIFARYAQQPPPARSTTQLKNRQQDIRAVRIERPMCSNCNAPVSRHGARFCMACTFPHEREKRAQASKRRS